jgi:hypothetical protein
MAEEEFEDRKRAAIMKFSESTVMPLSLILVLMGAAFWIGQIYRQTAIDTQVNESILRKIENASERLSYIEGKMGLHDARRKDADQ